MKRNNTGFDENEQKNGDEAIIQKCQTIKFKMSECVERDNSNNKENMAATNKLDNINEFVNCLLNKRYQEILLDDDILSVVKKWLEPLPDKSLPNIKIKKSLLDTLKILNVDKHHLLDSGVGKIVYFYAINPKETKEIRDLANEVVHRWTRRIIKDNEL